MYCASVSKFNDEPTVVVALLIVAFKLSIKSLSFKIDLIVSDEVIGVVVAVVVVVVVDSTCINLSFDFNVVGSSNSRSWEVVNIWAGIIFKVKAFIIFSVSGTKLGCILNDSVRKEVVVFVVSFLLSAIVCSCINWVLLSVVVAVVAVVVSESKIVQK